MLPRMPDTIPLECHCGTVRGTLDTAPRLRRLSCYCRSCSGFARHLGHADKLLDEHGGTDIVQVTPSQLRLATGHDQLRCLRLSKTGPLRWYLACCKTPVGNTLDKSWLPFVGVPSMFTKSHAQGPQRDEAFGPVRYRLHTRFVDADVPGGHPSGPPGLIFKTASGLIGDGLRGRHRPTPFFDAAGNPTAQPERLSGEELAAVGLR